jgi:hypothetical protein
MTLPEVLIVITMMGLIAAVLSTAITVTIRQSASTEGRANVARAETAIDTWLPADLASTDVNNTTLPAVDLDPAATPCGNCGGIDLSGANALQLAWETDGVVTRVQYQYIQVGEEWQMQRIVCEGTNPCRMSVMLHDLEGPPDPATFDPTVDRPVWVMDVAVPTDPAGLELSDNARRIVVTVDGGGENEGAGGGLNSVSLTAGGQSTENIDADDFTVPSFVRAKSRCGGPVTLVVDDSGSIGGNVNSVVKPGVKAFIEAFRGTPTQIQLVQFSSQAQTIGPNNAETSSNGGWHRYIDMTNDAQVDALKSAVDSSLVASGGTNWEEAFFHTFKESDGTTAATVPNRIVFFTDGIPTRNRTSRSHGWWGQYSNGDKYIHYNDGHYNSNWPIDNGSSFNQESYDRADVILDQHRNVDMIFVGVGPDLNNNISWIHHPAVYQDRTVNPPAAETKQAWETIAYLLANAPTGQVPAVYDSGAQEYTNPETADFYLQNSFDADAFAAAMKAAALKDCGGTLTVQTRLSTDGSPVADEFVYENPGYRDDAGDPINAEARRVTTSTNFRTGTFDFEISSDTAYFSVDIVPSELQTLDHYAFAGWSCRAGADAKTHVPIPITDSTFEGFTVDVYANEAVSCILEVTP